ncbi:MAG: U32 family peptidase C-terminal domain-containing protein, partial [Lachnospiraceae bacterium]
EEQKEKEKLVKITQRNKFCVGDIIEIMKPSGENIEVCVEKMYDEEGNAVESAPHPQQEIWLKLSVMPAVQDILRVKNITDI